MTDDTSYDLPQDTEDDSGGGTYPELPLFGDPRWLEAAVAPRKQRSTQLRPAPRTMMSTGQATVFAGDIVHIMPDVVHEDWVAARVGRKLGWLNTDDVEFVDPNAPKQVEELTKPLGDTKVFTQIRTGPLSEDKGDDTESIDEEASITQASRPAEVPKSGGNGKVNGVPSREDIPVNLTVGEIDAMLEHLKGLAMALQQAKVRALREAGGKPKSSKQQVQKAAARKKTTRQPSDPA